MESNLFFILASMFDFALSVQDVVSYLLLLVPFLFKVIDRAVMGTRRCVVDRDKVEEMLRRHNGKDGRWTMRLKVLLTVVADILVITSRNWKLKRLGLVKCLLTIGCHRSHSVSIARAILRVLRWHAVGGRTNLGPVAD